VADPSSEQDPLTNSLREIGHPEQRIEDLEREVERLRAALAARPATEVSPSSGVETGGPGALGRGASEVEHLTRAQLGEALLDWLHETPLSKCNRGSDTCATRSLAYEAADFVLRRLAALPVEGSRDG
jgi:hypothetical protein